MSGPVCELEGLIPIPELDFRAGVPSISLNRLHIIVYSLFKAKRRKESVRSRTAFILNVMSL